MATPALIHERDATVRPALTAPALIDIVESACHASAAEWLFFRELRVGAGRRNNAAQRFDAFALNTLPHLAMKRVCYEVKTSRADFLGELKHPLKRRMGMRYSNEFYFVTPAGLVSLSEVPSECGLIEAGHATHEEWKNLFPCHAGFFSYNPETQAFCILRIPAPWRDTPGPTWQLTAAMLRNQKRGYEDRIAPPVQQRLTFV